MARELRRLLIAPERLALLGSAQAAGAQPLTLSAEERHYLQRVLRLRDGDAFAVVDGIGHLWHGVLERGQAVLQDPLAQPRAIEPAPWPRLQLAVALPRRDADVLLRMATELGIDRVQPLLSERSTAERSNPQRHGAIMREALEQCERLWLPELADVCSVAQLLAAAGPGGLWATTRQHDLPSLTAALQAVEAAQALPQTLTVAIGPEGGWSPAEDDQALAHGWQPVQLGETILRCSTAAVAAATLLCSWRSSRA